MLQGRWLAAVWWVIFLSLCFSSLSAVLCSLSSTPPNNPHTLISPPCVPSLSYVSLSPSLCRLADGVHHRHARSSGGGLWRGLRSVLSASGQRRHGNCHHHRLHCYILKRLSIEEKCRSCPHGVRPRQHTLLPTSGAALFYVFRFFFFPTSMW